jgi:4-diphosphocytidyl-2-C-methyl-D-erythritol kinase
MKTIKLKAPAKINLTLEVLRRLPNGFHEVRFTMARINNIYDEISITFYPKKEGISVESSNNGIPLDERNICFKVAKKFFEKAKKSAGIKIYIKKNIPVGAGLGGGSSDGAAVLKILNKYFNSPLSEKQLMEIGSEVGKDIPFFFSSQDVSFVEGMGEKISETVKFPKINILLVNPGIHISTKHAYERLSPIIEKIKRKENVSRKMMAATKKKDASLIARYLYNDFEIILEKEQSIIKEIKDELIKLGALGALMTGSGSTVFGIFKNRKEILAAKRKMKIKYPDFFVEIG